MRYEEIEKIVSENTQLEVITQEPRSMVKENVVFLQGAGETSDPAMLHNIEKRIIPFCNVYEEPIPIVKDITDSDKTCVVLFGSGFTESQLQSILDKNTFALVDCIDTVPANVTKTTFESMIIEMLNGYTDKEFRPVLKIAKDKP